MVFGEERVDVASFRTVLAMVLTGFQVDVELGPVVVAIRAVADRFSGIGRWGLELDSVKVVGFQRVVHRAILSNLGT